MSIRKIKIIMKKITIKDVANRAGVSAPVVSVILNKKSSGSNTRFSEETRERVLQVAEEMKYRPDIFGRSLRHNRSYLIGVLLFDVDAFLMPDVLSGLQNILIPQGTSPLLLMHRSEEEEETHLNYCLERKVDGLIIDPFVAGGKHFKYQRYIELAARGLPLVELFGFKIKGIPSAAPDFKDIICKAVVYLNSLGHEKIAFLNHSRDNLHAVNFGESYDAWILTKEYLSIMKKLNREAYLIRHEIPDNQQLTHADWKVNSGKHLDYIIREGVSAVVCYNTHLACGLIEAAFKKGVAVPDDLSIVAISDDPAAETSNPPITSISINPGKIGEAAAKMILNQLDGISQKENLIPGKLCIRKS